MLFNPPQSSKSTVIQPMDASAALRLWLRADSCKSVGNGNAITAWGDRSGNDYDATMTGSPTFIADGGSGFANKPIIRFSGTAKGATGSGCSVNAVNHTGMMVVKVTGFTPGTQQSLLNFTSVSHFIICSAGSGALNVGLYDSGGFLGRMFLPLNVPVILTWISSSTGFIFRVNGVSICDDGGNSRLLTGVGPASATTGTATTVNFMNNQFSQPTAGDLAEVCLWNAALPLHEVAALEAAMAARYGITMRSNGGNKKRVILFGDSRSTPGSAAQQAVASTTLSSLRNALGLDWLVQSQGISGNTPANMDTRADSDVCSLRDDSLDKDIVIVWAGVNGITAGTSAATLYASLTSIYGKLKTAGFKVIACTEVQNTDLTSPQNTVRDTLNTSINGTAAPGTVDAICDLYTALGAGQATHPNQASGVTLANAMAASVLTL